MNSKAKFRISGTGCALVDYLYKPVDFSGPECARYMSVSPGDGGLAPGKLVFTGEFEKFSREPYPGIRQLITKGNDPVALNIGGPSIVSLIHAAQMLQLSGAEVRFYGCRGSDAGGAFIEEKLKLTPLKTGLYKTGTLFTPFTDVLSDPEYDHGHGERIFINNIGAAWELYPSDLDESFFDSDMVVFGGTALVPHIHEALGDLLIKAKEKKAVTVVNTVYDFLNEKSNPGKPWPLGDSVKTYRYIDLLITDMEEAFRLSGQETVDSAIGFFKSTGVGAVIITHGANPLYFFSDHGLFGEVPFSSLPVSERVKSELRQNAGKEGDTTGCGDNFTGGVIASVASQMMEKPGNRINLFKAIAFGVASGGFACFYNGGTYFEKNPGEKSASVGVYFREYLKQIGFDGSE